MARYNPNSPADRETLGLLILSRLSQAGFAQTPLAGAKEIVCARAHEFRGRATGISVRVLTTAVRTGETYAVRAKDKDAIRVQLVTDDRILATCARVFRVGEIEEVAERTIERCREVWLRANAWPRCTDCGSPRAISKKKKWYCAALCWKKEETA